MHKPDDPFEGCRAEGAFQSSGSGASCPITKRSAPPHVRDENLIALAVTDRFAFAFLAVGSRWWAIRFRDALTYID